MKNQNSISRIVRRICTIALFVTIIAQILSVILLEVGTENSAVEELHEICGFLFFGLVLIHILLFRKSLKNMFISKVK